MIKVVFATSNKGKAREAAEILGDTCEIVLPSEFGINEEAEETGGSFQENAELKASFIFEKLHGNGMEGIYAVFADDSGLEVDALGGEPGIYTARYAGEDKNFSDNMDKLLTKLREAGATEPSERKARFRCAVCLLSSDGQKLISEGSLEGHIAPERSGNGGFGYDPVFIPDTAELAGCLSSEDAAQLAGRTLADIPEDVKNRISHRYKALHGLKFSSDGQSRSTASPSDI